MYGSAGLSWFACPPASRYAPLRGAHEREPGFAHEDLGAAARRRDAEIAAARDPLHRHGAGEEGIAPVRPRRREDPRVGACEQGLDLVLGLAHGGGGGHDLRAHRSMFGIAAEAPTGTIAKTAIEGATEVAHAQRLDRGFVQPHHGAQRTGDEVQLVLDHEVGRRQRAIEAPARRGSAAP